MKQLVQERITSMKFSKRVLSLLTMGFLVVATATADEPKETRTVVSIEDAYVQGGDSRDSNFGSSVQMSTKNNEGEESDVDRMSYVKFDIQEIIDIAANEYIGKATLRLYVHWTDVGAANVNVILSEVIDNSWSETTLTYNNRPFEGEYITELPGENMGWTTEFEENRYMYFDITDYIKQQQEKERGIVSFHLYHDQPDMDYKGDVQFSTHEAPDERKWPVIIAEIYEDNGSSIDDVNAQGKVFSAYPNPAALNETVFVEVAEGAGLIEVYNMLGQCVNVVEATSPTVELSFAQTGIYFIKVKGSNTTEGVKVVVK